MLRTPHWTCHTPEASGGSLARPWQRRSTERRPDGRARAVRRPRFVPPSPARDGSSPGRHPTSWASSSPDCSAVVIGVTLTEVPAATGQWVASDRLLTDRRGWCTASASTRSDQSRSRPGPEGRDTTVPALSHRTTAWSWGRSWSWCRRACRRSRRPAADVDQMVTQGDRPPAAVASDGPGPAVPPVDAGDLVVVPVTHEDVAGLEFFSANSHHGRHSGPATLLQASGSPLARPLATAVLLNVTWAGGQWRFGGHPSPSSSSLPELRRLGFTLAWPGPPQRRHPKTLNPAVHVAKRKSRPIRQPHHDADLCGSGPAHARRSVLSLRAAARCARARRYLRPLGQPR